MGMYPPIIQEGKIEYGKGIVILGVFEELSWNSEAIEEVIENLELIGDLS